MKDYTESYLRQRLSIRHNAVVRRLVAPVLIIRAHVSWALHGKSSVLTSFNKYLEAGSDFAVEYLNENGSTQ